MTLGDKKDYFLHQRLAAYALIADSSGRMLLTRPDQRRVNGRWVLPGGGVEHGEHPEQALVREVEEETGLGVTVGALRYVLSDITAVGRRHRRLHNVRLVYEAAVTGATEGAAQPRCPPGGQARWCSEPEWRELTLVPFTATVLGDRSLPDLPRGRG